MVGESGCGKTTTILALMGLLPPTASVSGRVLFDGVDVLERGEETIAPHRWKDIAMVFQGAMNAFDPVKRIGDQIVEPMELHGHATGKRGAGPRPRAARDASGSRPSGRGATRTSSPAGCASAPRSRWRSRATPRVLLADEPTTALDVMVQAQILELLTYLSNELGLALVFVTHDLPIVAQTCTHAAVMYAGRIVEQGPTEALYHETRHPYTRMLWAATPDLDVATTRSSRSPACRRGSTPSSTAVRSRRAATSPRRAARPSGPSCARWATAT